MNTPLPQDFRRARRRRVDGVVPVVDTMTDAVVGRIGNLSETGMLLIASAPLAEDALYQFRFELPAPTGALTVEAGMHALWQDRNSASGQTWAGLRVISMPVEHLRRLREWLDAPGSRYE